MKRRTFLELAGLGLADKLAPRALTAETPVPTATHPDAEDFGSGHFGQWQRDTHGLPCYRYTCNQLTDPLAVLPVDKTWRSPTDHMHQVGNDRIIAIASNYGHLQIRQDEGSPKFLNDYDPAQDRYGAGIGFLADDTGHVLSTYYTGKATSFDRVLGIGYLQKIVAAGGYIANQVLFAPHGDDPVLISQVTLTNTSSHIVRPRWIEYWGCSNYQLSYRSLMESGVIPGSPNAVDRRRDLAARFEHRFRKLEGGRGLLESQAFLGRTPEEEQAWQQTQANLKAKPTGFFGGPTPPLAPGASMDDLAPPATFLASLDAAPDGFATDATRFFSGSIERPAGLAAPLDAHLDDHLDAHGPESAFFLQHQLTLQPGESRTLHFLYGYIPEGFSAEALIAKYSAAPEQLWSQSSAAWKSSAPLFRAPAHPWIEREAIWSSYYLRCGLTYDAFFREHILSQGAGYQYLAGLQGAARDPLQHVLPLILTDPAIVRGVIRYTLKEIQPDGSIPYAIVGHGVPMPCVYHPSDLQLWVLWVASEYVLATRDQAFLHERIPLYPGNSAAPGDAMVLDLLARSFTHLTTTIGVGKHGLLRLFNGDWNDSIVYTHLTPEQSAETLKVGESVLNAAMATYVFDFYARMLDFVDRPDLAKAARTRARSQREAVQAQWHDRWYRRAWLGEDLGWVGEKQMWLEPQPWAILGNCVPPAKLPTLVAALNDLARKPSPIGALLQSQHDPTMKDEPGTGTNGGIFAAINGTLIWALAQVDGQMAWDEWKKNTLAHHAHTYPNLWFGIWSGPDAYHSVLSKWPGGTGPDFPVLNMHSHAWPLYSALKLLGTDFRPNGVSFKPVIPLAEYEFQAPLLGFRKTPQGFSGWYAPLVAGQWQIELTLSSDDLKPFHRLSINGESQALRAQNGVVRFTGPSAPDKPLRWEIDSR